MNGVYQSELFGDNYIPSLIGITKLNKFNSLENKNLFENSHKYVDISLDIKDTELDTLKEFFKINDKFYFENNLIFETARWQLFLDLYKDFASIPPYGKINAINKSTGELNWEIPFGQKITSNGNIVGGDINFGGILTTSGNIFFATGTPDKFIRSYDSKTGNKLWQFKMDYAGSSPPMTYLYNDEQYIIVNSSGGRFFGYEEKLGDEIYAFKIN